MCELRIGKKSIVGPPLCAGTEGWVSEEAGKWQLLIILELALKLKETQKTKESQVHGGRERRKKQLGSDFHRRPFIIAGWLAGTEKKKKKRKKEDSGPRKAPMIDDKLNHVFKY